MTDNTYTAFEGHKILAKGSLNQVVARVKYQLDSLTSARVLIFSDITGKEMDFNFQGSEAEVLKRIEVFVDTSTSSKSANSVGPGRPRLGVMSREISLLPRHWEWLANQPGGASATLRRLVEDVKKKTGRECDVKSAQEVTYRFMSVLAGNLEGYEEALRTLYRKNKKEFLQNSKSWPKDVREHALKLGRLVFES